MKKKGGGAFWTKNTNKGRNMTKKMAWKGNTYQSTDSMFKWKQYGTLR